MPVNSIENYPMAWKPQKEKLTKPYYLSIASCLENDILTVRLLEDAKLPPQRELADYLDLNLSTIRLSSRARSPNRAWPAYGLWQFN